MRISKLSASKHKKGRILVQLDSGELLRIGEREVVAFSLYVGKELTAQERAALENRKYLQSRQGAVHQPAGCKPRCPETGGQPRHDAFQTEFPGRDPHSGRETAF